MRIVVKKEKEAQKLWQEDRGKGRGKGKKCVKNIWDLRGKV